MKKVIYVVLASSLLLSLNGCEWFNTTILGNPSKAEIAKKIQLENERKDSLARVEQEAAALTEQQQKSETSGTKQRAGLNQRYHVIVGCFLMQENADKMMALLTSRGYQPLALAFVTEYTCISAQSFDNLQDAFDAMANMLRDCDFCPDDAWIYDTNDLFHENY